MLPEIVGFDTETHLIRPGVVAPPLVCHTFSGGTNTRGIARDFASNLGPTALFNPELQPGTDEWGLIVHRLAPKETVTDLYLALLDAALLTAHNLSFDARVIEHDGVFDPQAIVYLYETGMIRCTMVRERLVAIAQGNLKYDTRIGRTHHFSLADLVEIYYGEETAAILRADKAKAVWIPEKQDFEITGNVNSWRLRYKELEDVPLARWPDKAIDYAIEDALWARRIWLKQAEPIAFPEGVVVYGPSTAEDGYGFGDVHDEFRQTPANHALGAIERQGVRTNPATVARFKAEVEHDAAKVDTQARILGFLRVNKCKECEGTGWIGDPPHLDLCVTCMGDPMYLPPRARVPLGKTMKHTKRLQSWVSYHYGHQPPLTDPSDKYPHGQVKTDEDTLSAIEDPRFKVYLDGLSSKKLLSTYVPILEEGAHSRIHPRFTILVRSGRTSASNPNYQNPPRAEGFRECHEPAEGNVFAALDFSTLELRTWAQTCLDLFGHSDMADAFAKGVDPHLDLGLDLLRLSEDVELSYPEGLAILNNPTHKLYKLVKYYRQLAKIANFGFPGGLGAEAFVDYCRGYGVSITLVQAQQVKDNWLSKWSESEDFFAYIRALCDNADERDDNGRERFRVVQPASGRIRGRCSYTSGANTMFQGPAADGLKVVLWWLYREMYANPDSVLNGVRAWNVIHDEVLFEGPEETAHLWAPAAARIMEEAMRTVTPDIPQIVEPALSRRWTKAAHPAYDKEGKLIPFEDVA